MRIGIKQLLVFLAIGCVRIGTAGTVSYTSPPPLANLQDFFETTATLSGPGTLTLQTWGFGGGINSAGATIPAGGFDPLVAVFMGTGPGATFVEGTSDVLDNYPAFVGCPPAGVVTIGTGALATANCGDVLMALSLSAGTYTILLSDAAYIPAPIFLGVGTLGDGFVDLTPGTFQTCLRDGSACISDTANWALDVSVSSPSPEPGPRGMACIGLLGLAVLARLRSRVGIPWLKRKQARGGVQI